MRIIYVILGSRTFLFMASLLAVSCFTAMTAALAADGEGPGPMPESLQAMDKQRAGPSTGVRTLAPEESLVLGQEQEVRRTQHMYAGAMLPDGKGGYVWAAMGEPVSMPDLRHEAGREIKLKVRELADQLFSAGNPDELAGAVALPTSFVSQDNFQESSSLGRYIAEQMIYECNQRGLPVMEYRIGEALFPRQGEGDFLLSRAIGEINPRPRATLMLVGTYYADSHNVFVNSRLLRAEDGLVLRTGSLVFGQTQVTRTMLANTGMQLEAGVLQVRDYESMTADRGMTDIDLGWDIR